MKYFYFFIFLFLVQSVTANAQQRKKRYVGYFVTEAGDTTFCRTLRFDCNAQGSLNELAYVDIDGNKVDLKGKNKMPEVVTFLANGKILDKVPFNVNKPNGYTRFAERIADGKLMLYRIDYQVTHTSTNSNGTVESEKEDVNKFIIKMPDGTYYSALKKGNIREVIKPYLLECAEFKAKYKGNFDNDEYAFKKMIMLYNSSCK